MWVERTPEEMKQLADLVQAALGFNAQRGDELSIQNISFEAPPIEVQPAPTPAQRTLRIIAPWIGLLRYAGLAALFLVIYLLILRPVKNQVLATMKSLSARSGQAALAPGEERKAPSQHMSIGELEEELEKDLSGTSSEVMRAVVLKRHLVAKIRKEPEGASRLIQTWVRQGEA